MTSTACDDQFTAEPDDNIETRAARQLTQNQPNATSLNPRYLPRTYPEMLQDIVALRDRLEKFDGTDARNMAYALGPAAAIAADQLERLSRNAVKRMLGGSHAV